MSKITRSALWLAAFLALSWSSPASATTIQRVVSPKGIEAWLVEIGRAHV